MEALIWFVFGSWILVSVTVIGGWTALSIRSPSLRIARSAADE